MVLVPSAKRAYEDLVEGHRERAETHTRQQAMHVRKDLADFLMAGLRLEAELCVLHPVFLMSVLITLHYFKA